MKSKLARRTVGMALFTWIFATPLLGQSDGEQLEQQALYDAANEAARFVVKIETIGGAEKVDSVLISSAPTSGVIVGSDGYIVSSEFAFIQNPTSILVELPNGKRKAAKIVSRDHRFRLVLLKVDVDDPLDAPEPNHDKIEVGQWAVTVARTIPGDSFIMSVGIVSATNRVWGKAIQVDANVSPANYGGALVDIQGRVRGVLVPLSPNSNEVVAGAEWYDSGIGFAVPFDRIFDRLEEWKENDLHSGKLGIAMKSENLYGAEASIGVCRPKSPARDADLRAEDTIVSANGIPVSCYAHLKHVLGPLVAGETVVLEIQRGDEMLTKSIELTDKLEPYEHAFLGILPAEVIPTEEEEEEEESRGVAIRHVFEDSPASEAELQIGDVIIEINGEATPDEITLRQLLAAYEPSQEVEIKSIHEQETITKKIKLVSIGDTAPDSVAPRFDDVASTDEDLAPLGKISIKLPEEANECDAYIPESYDPQFHHALLVMLPVPGKKNTDALIRDWRDACDKTRTILLIPRAKDARSWAPTETKFVRKTVENLRKDYAIDADRVVVCGTASSGSMALLVGFEFRDLVRGVATLNGAIPSRASGIFNEPLQRLSFWIASEKEGQTAKRLQSNAKLLRALKFPVTQTETEAKEVNEEVRDAILLWMDTLDRI